MDKKRQRRHTLRPSMRNIHPLPMRRSVPGRLRHEQKECFRCSLTSSDSELSIFELRIQKLFLSVPSKPVWRKTNRRPPLCTAACAGTLRHASWAGSCPLKASMFGLMTSVSVASLNVLKTGTPTDAMLIIKEPPTVLPGFFAVSAFCCLICLAIGFFPQKAGVLPGVNDRPAEELAGSFWQFRPTVAQCGCAPRCKGHTALGTIPDG